MADIMHRRIILFIQAGKKIILIDEKIFQLSIIPPKIENGKSTAIPDSIILSPSSMEKKVSDLDILIPTKNLSRQEYATVRNVATIIRNSIKRLRPFISIISKIMSFE